MRVALFLVFCVGCGPEALRFEQTGTLAARTSGVQLGDDGRTAWAGMIDTTCEINAQNGAVIGDGDVPGLGDRLLDARGRRLLVEAEGRAHRVQIGGGAPLMAIATNVRGGALLADEAVLVHEANGACEAVFGFGAGSAAVNLAGLDCSGPVSVVADAAGERVFVSDGSLTLRIAGGIAEALPELAGADQLVLDEARGILLAARQRDGLVRAFQAESGEALWTREARGALVGLDVMTDEGAVVAVLEDGGEAELAALDIETGDQRLGRNLPELAVPVAGRGQVDLGLVTEDMVYFYELEVGSSLSGDPSFGESDRVRFASGD